jgi:NADPH:quinone reductase-like Zn-dependent oxidoreductase
MAEMLSIATPAYSDPSRYEVVELPRPTVSEPTDVLIQVHAASINPIDVKLAAGMLKMAVTDEYAVACFPFRGSASLIFKGSRSSSDTIARAW